MNSDEGDKKVGRKIQLRKQTLANIQMMSAAEAKPCDISWPQASCGGGASETRRWWCCLNGIQQGR